MQASIFIRNGRGKLFSLVCFFFVLITAASGVSIAAACIRLHFECSFCSANIDGCWRSVDCLRWGCQRIYPSQLKACNDIRWCDRVQDGVLDDRRKVWQCQSIGYVSAGVLPVLLVQTAEYAFVQWLHKVGYLARKCKEGNIVSSCLS